MNLARISALAAPLAAMALGAFALSACGSEEDKLAQNGYTVPSERDTSNYATPSSPSITAPVAPSTPNTTVPPARPADPDDPAPLPPGSPPPPLPN
jgi:hypothetical protein